MTRPSRPLLLALALAAACGDGPSDPVPPPRAAFEPERMVLVDGAAGTLGVRNVGEGTLGPLTVTAGPLLDGAGASLPGARVSVTPASPRSLRPGEAATLSVQVEVDGPLPAGAYGATLQARAPGAGAASARLTWRVAEAPAPVASLALSGDTVVRQGDAVPYRLDVRGSGGGALAGVAVTWRVEPEGSGSVSPAGRLVAYAPGGVRLIAAAGGLADTVAVRVLPRGLAGRFEVVGRGPTTTRFTSDLWVSGGFAYLGTWGVREGVEGASTPGNALRVWDVRYPSRPALVDSVIVDARTVNDVKVSPNGRLAVLTHEGSSDGLNGITILDLSEPAHPRVVARHTTGLGTGVHNVWLENDVVYAVEDGRGIRVVDLAWPAAPVEVASYYGGTSTVHDVLVRDGLAFVSHWDAGLVLLDVGLGLAGGSPSRPVEVGRLAELGGQTHNAWYWPERGYAFVGEEDYASPGLIHVVDVRDPRRPREVASFVVPGQTPHNVWLDEAGEVLYVAWYGEGVVAIDVSGELLGPLHRQGREIAHLRYGGPEGCDRLTGTCSWAPQVEGGLVYVSDLNLGLVVLRLAR